jgi:hypothetical protein
VARSLGADARTASNLAELAELHDAVEHGLDITRSSALTFVDAAEDSVRLWQDAGR